MAHERRLAVLEQALAVESRPVPREASSTDGQPEVVTEVIHDAHRIRGLEALVARQSQMIVDLVGRIDALEGAAPKKRSAA